MNKLEAERAGALIPARQQRNPASSLLQSPGLRCGIETKASMNTSIDCHQLVAAVGDAIIASDATGSIVLWNFGAQKMFGYTEAEALGRSLDLITPERLRKRHWDGYSKSMASGTTKYGSDLLRVPAVHKDGSDLSIAFTVAMLFSPTNGVDAIVAVIRDETARFNDDRALRKRVAELEGQLAASG